VAAGPDALRTLATPGEGAVAHIVSGGAYLRISGDRWLFLSHPRTPMGPLSLRLDRPLTGLFGNAPIALTSTAIHLGDQRIPIPRAFTGGRCPAPGPPQVGVHKKCLTLFMHERLLQTLGTGLAQLSAAPAELTEGLQVLQAGHLVAAVGSLAGRGEGLTPAGDDVLAGYAAWAAFTDGPSTVLSQSATGRSSPLGLAYLRCAERGEVVEPAERLLVAALTGDVPGAQRAARALRGWGASSGTALAWGMAACAAGTRPAALPQNVSRG
jgi:Protein of unknown function (DUF2877)